MTSFYPFSPIKLLLLVIPMLNLLITSSVEAQTNVNNTRPTLNPIADYTTSFSTDTRYVELNGITPGGEADQQVFIDVSTEDKDLIESIGADFVDNGKAFINYRVKEGAAGTATVKVIVTDDGPTPASVTRIFRITIEALNRELPSKSLDEEATHNLKAFPNPAVLSTRVYFSTPEDEQRISVDLYNLSGTKISQIYTGATVAHKSYYVDLNSRNLAAGVYIVKLTGQSHIANLKLAVAK